MVFALLREWPSEIRWKRPESSVTEALEPGVAAISNIKFDNVKTSLSQLEGLSLNLRIKFASARWWRPGEGPSEMCWQGLDSLVTEA